MSKVDSFIGSTFQTPKGGVLTVVGDNGLKGNKKRYQLTCSICSLDGELFPELFESPKGNLVNGAIPCGCSKKPEWKPFQINIIVSRLCLESGYGYIGFPEGYKNHRSKFEYNCPIHGKQKASYQDFVNGDSRCHHCSGTKKKTLSESETIVKEICTKEGYGYLDFPEGYKNAYSKFEYLCPVHGKQIVSYDGFVNHNSRCPSCSTSGYQPSKPGYFYLFKYEKENHIPVYKYGITNRLTNTRSKEHIKGIKNVKSQLIYEWYFEDGTIPQSMERYIKNHYETGVSDWLTSGNTETVQAYDNNFEKEAGSIIMLSQME
ncbi:hypothetical protein [Aeromonas hydrophila]|uniref:hypothetical protein n=1 Tax=Aeromonas hydrophila TaxID=644 RepID=UPI00158331C4|nr:hypothetical protein [Aeromonas hydrophila]